LRWIIGLRWAVVASLLLVVVLGHIWKRYSAETDIMHLGLALSVLVYNLFYIYASRQPGFGQSTLTTLVRYAQVPIDLFVVTALVHFFGGVTGPVFVLYFLYIFVGLAILPPSGAYWVAGIAALCYGLLSASEAFWAPTPESK